MSLQVFQPSGLSSMVVQSLVVDSRRLRGNPLGDSTLRRHPVLSPADSAPEQKLPLVVVLAGFSSSGEKYLAPKAFEQNFAQSLDAALVRRQAPRARYLLVDALTFWGGSQFLNSAATGRYEDALVRDVLPALFAACATDLGRVCVTGTSSGGYGALHLASRYPELFPYCSAMAPDSAFEISLLADLRRAAPWVGRHSVAELRKLHAAGGLLTAGKAGFAVINALAMCACYSPRGTRGDFNFPLDPATGEWIPAVLRRWREKDPVHFLPRRIANVRKLKRLWLEVGDADEYGLHFGARKIRDRLRGRGVRLEYEEFAGGHFDFAARRLHFWKKLQAHFG